MIVLELTEDLRARMERSLDAYARGLIETSARLARRLHADEVGAEHLVCALMEDEDCAAHRLVVSAFADPQTVSEEVHALAAGILVTGSSASMPFSEGGVRALEDALFAARSLSEGAVHPGQLLGAAARRLPAEAWDELVDAGYEAEALEGRFGRATQAAEVQSGMLFKSYTDGAKRALSSAAKVARQTGDDAIGPVHLMLAALGEDEGLSAVAGVSLTRVRSLFRGRTADPTPLSARSLPPDDTLAELLGALPEAPEGRDSLGLLARIHAGATPDLAQVLVRHRITPALLTRSGGAFRDPEDPAGSGTCTEGRSDDIV